MSKDSEARATVKLLGGFNVLGSDGAPIEISGRKTKALIAILALSPDFSASRDRLVGLLWSERGDEQARNSLRQALVALKRELGEHGLDIIAADRDRVGLSTDHLEVDAVEFNRLAAAGNAGKAVALYSGALLDRFFVRDEAFEDWMARERLRFSDLAIGVHEKLLNDVSGSERVAVARRLLALDPLREAAHRLLMEALAAAGERDQALRQYETCREMLRSELGVEPDSATRMLNEEIVQRNYLLQLPTPASTRQRGDRFEDRTMDDRTMIAVLPFTNLSGNAEQDFFADGISEDLITELARYRHLSVIGHRMSSRYRDRRESLSEIVSELSVDFLVEGSVRVAGSKVRVVVQLIDATTGAHVWADRFDREMVDIFSVQDQIVGAVIARLAFNLDEAAGKQRQSDPTTSSSAYTCFLRARAAWRGGDEDLALQSAQQAAEIDPDYGRAHAYIGYFYAYSLFSQWTGLQEAETLLRAREAIERALAADRGDPFILQRAAITYLMLGNADAAFRYAEAAANESACDSEILIIRGLVLAYCGRHEEGVAMLERAVELERRLSPGCFAALSEGRHMLRNYAGSLTALEMIIDPPYYVRLCQAANLARLGQVNKARHIVADAPAGFDSARFARSEARMCVLPKDAEHWLESFRLAGVGV